MRNTRPDESLVGTRRRQQQAFLRRGGRGDVGQDPPAVREHERHDVLLDAVLVDLEVSLVQVRHEPAAVVPHDQVGGHVGDAAPDDFALGRLAGQSKEGYHEK